jgi:UDP-N-acetylglucosamine--N-acetylmuramyl-(pentapeptide) pyrophosphoryl-undecaprenol N-acetylglucosamine transferase
MYKVLITTGGTGGHIFPAQALATQLYAKGINVLFAGGGLRTNKYFKKETYFYIEVASSPPFKGNIFKAWWNILRGVVQSLKVIAKYKPNLVIGFGSFYSFPVLVAAKLKKIPIILFEPNAIPGKVNRLFSRWALLSTLQFEEASRWMKGKCIEVKMQVPVKKTEQGEAREYFYLDPQRFTFLVFGGSQGAESINHIFSQAISSLELEKSKFQVIHITGKTESAEQVRRWYATQGIQSCVKAFEEHMEKAWSSADYVVCRSGAWTVAEQIAAGVPALFIPFPRATDNHQEANARVVEKRGGAVTCEEAQLDLETMGRLVQANINPQRLDKMRASIASFKDENKKELSDIIYEFLIKR